MAGNPTGRFTFATTQKGIAAGVVVERTPARTTVLTAAGREVWGNDRVFWISEARAPLHSGKAATDALEAFLLRVEDARAGVDLATLWDLLADDGGRRRVEDLAELAFGECRPEHHAALAIALATDDAYFRAGGDDGFAPLPREAVEAALRRRQREAQEREQVERAAERLGELLDVGGRYDASDGTARTGVQWLKSLAVFGAEDRDGQRGAAVLASLAGEPVSDPELQAFRTLVRLAVFDEDEVLAIHRHRIPREFPAEVLDDAGRLAAATLPDPEAAGRSALAHEAGGCGPVSIDDPWTLDVDDALMIEPAGDCCRVHVLIADPTSRIPLDSRTGAEGMARAATLYLPTGKVPMLPEVLSQDALSLTRGAERPMLDFECLLCGDGTVESFRVAPVLATVQRHLTYDEADRIIADGAGDDALASALRRLRDLADGLRRLRVAAGATLVERDEVSVRVEGGDLVLRRLPWESPARRLVAEFMVLACTRAGAFAREHGIPVVYRRQNPPDDRNATAGLKPGTRAWAYRMVRSLRRAELTTQPDLHFGLGVVGYTQVTSPLRRFQDFVTHLQLKGFLRDGRAPLDTERILRVFGDLEARGDAVTQAEREAKRYYLLKYLKRSEGRDVPGEVVATAGSRAIVQLDETGLELPVSGGGRVPVGTRVEARVRDVDPRRDRVSLGLV
jgi:exoribonuclease-2